jgi:hypothetical protein
VNVKPMLGDWEIPHIDWMGAVEQRSFVELDVPGRTLSLLQDMSTTPVAVGIAGSLYGDEARDGFLEDVRGRFRAGEPLTFVADIVTATELEHVVVETLRFEQSAERPEEIDYVIVLRQSPPPPPPPSPLGGLDAGLLGEAAGFLDTVTGALDALDALGDIPDLGNPFPKLEPALDEVTAVAAGVGETVASLRGMFELPEE